MKVLGFEWWASCLRALAAGEAPPACPEAWVAFPGRYALHRGDGQIWAVAVDPIKDGTGVEVVIARGIRFPLQSKEQIEDWCEKTFVRCCENPVSHLEYVHWWNNNEWPPEVADRYQARRDRINARNKAQRRPRNPSSDRRTA